MLRLLRAATQHRLPSMRWTRVLAAVGVLGIGLLVLLNCSNNDPSPASSAQRAESGTPDHVTTGQPVPPPPAEDQESLASESLVTDDAVPFSATSTPIVTSRPTPDDDGAASTEISTEISAEEVPPTPEVGASSDPSSTAAETPSTNPSDTIDPHVSITRLLIPAIGVDAPVEVKSIDAHGVMQTPSSPDAVAWYDFSARPQDEGNVVIAGHLDYAGIGPAVFWRLSNVSFGDEITVMMNDGSEVVYRITTVESHSATADATQTVASRGAPTITLITCDGEFDPVNQEYAKRIVVTGERIR